MEEFLAAIASRERSQGRLSIAALTAACCAAQLEAQCREVRLYRQQAPGPHDVAAVIAGLQRVRGRLGAFVDRALAMETGSVVTQALPDSCLVERLRKQAANERMLTDFVVAGVLAASQIVSVARLARQVLELRREIRGGHASEEATFMAIAAASMAVYDVIERALRMSRLRDPRLRTEGFRALARLRPLCLTPTLEDEDHVEHTVVIDHAACWN